MCDCARMVSAMLADCPRRRYLLVARMLDGRSIAVVIPARDEAAWIASTIQGLPAFVDHVVVVDDGSSDETSAIAAGARPGTHVVRHDTSRGVGRALVTGYRRALELGCDVAVVMAGDGQMCPDDLPRLLEPILAGRAEYTKGNRLDHPDVRRVMPFGRYVAGRVLSRLTALAVGLGELSDSQSGYTAVTKGALSAIDLDAVWKGYGYPNDLIGRLARARQRVVDVTVRPVYRGEQSGLRPWHLAVVLGLIGRAAIARARAEPG